MPTLYTKKNKERESHLIKHDAIALKYTNDKVTKENEHWVILSYDGILAQVGNKPFYQGWVCSPRKFLEMTNITAPLSETQMVTVLHSVASFSERTLSIGAKIMDRIVKYASDEMQNWQFKRDLDEFKKEMKSSLSHITEDYDKELTARTDEFLKEKGIPIKEDEIDILLDGQ